MTKPHNNLQADISAFSESCEGQLLGLPFGVYYFGKRMPSGRTLVLIADDGEIVGSLSPPPSNSTTPNSKNETDWDWGNDSPASARLALALLSERIVDPAPALACHLQFAANIIRNLPPDQWLVKGVQIANWFKNHHTPISNLLP